MAHDVTYKPPRREAAPAVSRNRLILLAVLTAVNVAVVLYHGDPRGQPAPAANCAPLTAEPARLPAPGGASWGYDPIAGTKLPGEVQKVVTLGLRPGQTVAQALMGAGLAAAEVSAALAAMQHLIDFRRLRPGHELRARQDHAGALVSLDLRRSAADQVRAERAGSSWRAARLDIPVETRVMRVVGTIQSSLWEAMTSIGEDPRLAMDVAEVFSWDIDFYSDLHPGDTFRLLLEKRYAEGTLVEYGPILAAEFVTLGEAHRAFLHRTAGAGGSGLAYYDARGESLRKQLLKSPLKYAHVTSGFGWRRHPVLGYSRAHNGTDYGVPPGTPVWSVADGRVLRAGWVGGYGKMVEIRHANGYASLYGHLSQIMVRAGARVAQKDVIGLSGSTGLSTGPHLHYGLTLSGAPIDPGKQKFERAKPLAGAEREEFLRDVERLLGELQDNAVAAEMAIRARES